MKILLVHDFKKDLGGGEIHVTLLQKLLKEKGHKVITYFGADYNQGLKGAIRSFFNIRHYKNLVGLIKKHRPDIAHVHGSLYELSPSIYLAINKFKIPIIKTIHAFQYFCPRTSGIYQDGNECPYGFNNSKCLYKDCVSYYIGKQYIPWYFYKWLKIKVNRYFVKKYVHRFICPSHKMQQLMEKTLPSIKDRFEYLPNFVMLQTKKTRGKGKINKKQFISVGRLSKVKGLDIIIRAIETVVRKYHIKDVQLQVIGDGPERAQLKKLVNTLQLNKNIKFLGRIDNTKIDEYYQKSLALIIPSVWLDNNPLIAYEAMRNKRAIIASKVGGLPDLVKHEKNGYLFEAGKYLELATYMVKLLRRPELAMRMGREGFRKLTQKFSREQYYKELLEMYKNPLPLIRPVS